ncbi:two component transcriptional regulator, LuxR family [Nitrosococcus watsonii C-113]|uniref:Two component transcriptional regulator, LuxR family n=2 Tax=Nitrosococcus TaxID=1227 RepID=D8K4X6_NITWC|nr:two component transcriptional regulator, LuxR family [Nitrosococcus watsonii C-113]
MLESVSRLKVVTEASGAEEALQYLRSRPGIHVAIVDLQIHGAMNGIQLTEQIRSQFPHVIVLILSNQDKEEYIREAKQAGAHSYLWKETPWRKIVSIIEYIVDNPLGGFIRLESEAIPSPPPEKLSPKKRAVLRLMDDGQKATEMAWVLGTSTLTVSEQRKHIWQKFELKKLFQRRNTAIQYKKHHNKPDNNDD